MLIGSKKGQFGAAIYGIPSVILLVLILLIFGVFFFTEYSKPGDLNVPVQQTNKDLELINFLRTETTLNNRNIKIYELIQTSFENKDSEEALLLKEKYNEFQDINKEDCAFLKITSQEETKDYISIIGGDYENLELYRNLNLKHHCGAPAENSFTLISNKEPGKKGFIISIGE